MNSISVETRKNDTGSNWKSKPEDRLLFACCRQNFLAEHREALVNICGQEAINWDVVYQTAALHGVAPLVYLNLCKVSSIDIPPHILDLFKHALIHNMLLKERQAQRIVKALTFFAEKSIDVMLIKGAALDILVYEQPYYVAAQDADLVLKIKREQLSEGQFATFKKSIARGIEYDYFEHHDVIMNGILTVDFHKIWGDAIKTQYRGYNMFLMNPEDMLLALCINSCRKRYFKLKSLCDIAETLYAYPELDWTKLVQKARSYDCHNIVYTALLVTRETVGCALPEGLLDELRVGSLRARIIHYLSCQLSPESFSSLYKEQRVLKRSLDWSLILPYTTFQWYQIWRRLKYVVSS
jgi:hypothetical protein